MYYCLVCRDGQGENDLHFLQGVGKTMLPSTLTIPTPASARK
jgi:hypothetical protein